MKRSIFALALLISGCSQWGTSVLRPVDVWWACPDREERCSSENATLTYIQMVNTAEGVHRDYLTAEASGRYRLDELAPLREAVARMDEARGRVRVMSWDVTLQDFVQATVDAVRRARRYY